MSRIHVSIKPFFILSFSMFQMKNKLICMRFSQSIEMKLQSTENLTEDLTMTGHQLPLSWLVVELLSRIFKELT